MIVVALVRLDSLVLAILAWITLFILAPLMPMIVVALVRLVYFQLLIFLGLEPPARGAVTDCGGRHHH